MSVHDGGRVGENDSAHVSVVKEDRKLEAEGSRVCLT